MLAARPSSACVGIVSSGIVSNLVTKSIRKREREKR